MSDRAPAAGVAVWIALRRAHQGGVATLADLWLDSGRRVPCAVADALDGLTHAGLLVLGEEDPKSCGVRRVTVTDAGCAHYVALCQIHNPAARAMVRTPHRWACSPRDQRSHLLTEHGTLGILVGVCGHRMLWSVPTSIQPTGPRCLTCEALPTVPVPTPRSGRVPDSGRPPAEPTPGGRPDTTTAAGPIPDPQLPTETPAGRRSSCPEPLPAPGGQPNPHLVRTLTPSIGR